MHFNALSKGNKEKESIRAREDYVLLLLFIFIIVASRDPQSERAVFWWLVNVVSFADHKEENWEVIVSHDWDSV